MGDLVNFYRQFF